MQLKLFFLPSKAIASRITETFGFIWPTAAAIWNLRWQVQGLVGAYPEISEKELLGRFVQGSGIDGVNLRGACIETSWATQQEQFAKFLLFELCALYESWCELITDQLALPAASKKNLQFPTSVSPSGVVTGVANVTNAVHGSPSAVLSSTFHQVLSTNRKYSPNHLEEMLICYRYFKELRNALIHGSKSAISKLVSAQSSYSTLTPASLGVAEKPHFIPYNSSAAPAPSLRGVVGFGEIVLKLVCTMDIKLAESSFAEQDFKRRWKIENGSQPSLVAASEELRRNRRIGVLTKRLGLPNPAITPAFVAWLRSQGMIFH